MPSSEWTAEPERTSKQGHTRPPYSSPARLLVARRRHIEYFADRYGRADPAAAVRRLPTGITAHHHRYPICSSWHFSAGCEAASYARAYGAMACDLPLNAPVPAKLREIASNQSSL
jgi:hypothetical protein